MIKNIFILGCGAWGTTQALILNNNNCSVSVWGHDKKVIEDINTNNQNNVYLPDILLPKNIKFTSTLDNLVKEADLIVMAVASNFYRNVLRKIKPFVKSSHIILSTAKALEENTMKRMSQVVVEELSGIIKKDNVAVLSGPNLAFEIARGLPAATVIASVSNKTSEMVQKAYINDKLRVYTNTDVIGTELGGTIKNIIALAAGTIDGLDYGNNTKAALLVRGLKEMTRLGCSLGAKAETFFGLSGMGDLICTCNSNLSRNWKVGYEVAKGNRLEDVLSKMVAVAEGVNTSRVANELAKKIKVELPITEQVYKVLFERKNPNKAIADLMSRSPKAE